MAKHYDQYCAVAHALDLVGERWALLVVRELMHGPKRYTDLVDALPGIGTNILASRLRDLVADGVIAKRSLPPPAASKVYDLTDYGRDLRPVMRELADLGRSFTRAANRPVLPLRGLARERDGHRPGLAGAGRPVRVPRRRRDRVPRRR